MTKIKPDFSDFPKSDLKNFIKRLERECAIMLNKNIGWIPEEGENCHKKIGAIEIDFMVNNLLVDFHPWTWYKRISMQQYYDYRRNILNENGFSNNPLFVVRSLDEFEERILQLFGGNEL